MSNSPVLEREEGNTPFALLFEEPMRVGKVDVEQLDKNDIDVFMSTTYSTVSNQTMDDDPTDDTEI